MNVCVKAENGLFKCNNDGYPDIINSIVLIIPFINKLIMIDRKLLIGPIFVFLVPNSVVFL